MRGQRAMDESGFSFVEMAVVLLILAIVMAIVMRGFATFTVTATGADRRLQNLEEARTIMDAVSKDMRTAARLTASSSPFLLAKAQEAKFYANVDPTTGPNLVRIYVNAQSVLIEEVTPPPYTGAAKVRLVGKYVANPPSMPIFTYYDTDGNVLAPDPITGQLISDDLLQVDAVGITLSVRRTTLLPVVATTLVNRVSLPNVDFNPLPPTPTP